MTTGIVVAVLGVYFGIQVVIWFPLWQALCENAETFNHRHYPSLYPKVDPLDLGARIGYGALVFLMVVVWPLAAVPLISYRLWTGHWFPVPDREKVH